MKTKFEFRSNVGVVAGGDIGSNVGEVHLYINLDRQDGSRSIDEEQLQSVTRKIFSVSCRSGLDTLRLNEILRTKFGLDSISAMTVAEFGLVMAFLDGWETSSAQRSKTYTRPPFGVMKHRLLRTIAFMKNSYVGCLTALLLCLFALSLTIRPMPKKAIGDEQQIAFPAYPALTLPSGPNNDLRSTLIPASLR